MCEDLTSLDTFLSHYSKKCEQNRDLIVKVRSTGSDAFGDKYTILNPSLRASESGEFEPELDMELTRVSEYYLTGWRLGHFNAGTFVEVSRFKQENYKSTGLPLEVDIVSNISTFWETNEKYDVGSVGFDCDDLSDGVLEEYVLKPEETGLKHELIVHSDLPWVESNSIDTKFDLPFSILMMMIYGDNVIRQRTFEEADNNEDHEKRGPDLCALANQEYEVTQYVSNVFMSFGWPKKVEAVVSLFADTELMKFLVKREIPIWASILRNARARNLRDHELKYLNCSMTNIIAFRSKVPNAITEVALEYVFSFFDELNELGKVTLCLHCGRIIRFRRGKKYCSLRLEGSDCGKSARNHRYYSRHCETIREKNRRDMKLYRDLVKKVKDL